MKKLLCMLILATLIVGCSSNDQGKGKGATKDKEVVEKELKKDKENDDSKKDTAEDKSDEKIDSEEATPKSDETKVAENKNNNQTSGSSSNNGNQQEKPTQPSPPKEEAPTIPPQNPTPPPVVEPTPEPPTNQQAKADQVFAQINAYRQQNGKAPFAYSSLLKSQSDAHALAMATREALWHSGGAAECVTNYDDPFTAWKNSPAHNDILLCNNTEGAVGIYYYNGYYYSVFQCQW